MIKNIHVVIYRKLRDISLAFTPDVNIISGVNGTCKSSLLHIVSNAYQAVKQHSDTVADASCIKIVSKLNSLMNPKIEALARGDKKYGDPANGHKGTLYSITYENNLELDFRRHNSGSGNRYAVKPKYAKGTKDKLPTLPVIYLGLPRLYPYGEIGESQNVKDVRGQLPTIYTEELKSLYKELMLIDIRNPKCQDVNGFKKRGDFVTTHDGVDSNTISSGEDNVFIILAALVSLRYYFDRLKIKSGYAESVLLIDEFDATLHPSLQCRLMAKIREYSRKYCIQVIATTHSLTMIEDCLRRKDNVIYLMDNHGLIERMRDPDRYKIEAKLRTLSATDIYADRKIPLLMEDEESRIFLDEIFDCYLSVYNDSGFANVRNCFEYVAETFGADTLRKLFKNPIVSGAIRGICVLDGDQSFPNEAVMLACSTVVLPGKDSPENVVFKFAEKLYENPSDEFWGSVSVEAESFDCTYYEINIKPGYQAVLQQEAENCGKKPLRELAKNHFRSFQLFYKMVLRRMLREEEMQNEVMNFMRLLNILFKKNADFHRISSSRWSMNNVRVANGN